MREIINITGTDDTPEIRLNAYTGLIELAGLSIPEDANKFYEPVLDWLNEYAENPHNETKVIFKIFYYNSSSIVHFTKIFRILQKLFDRNHKVSLEWYYNKDDENVKEDGEEFKKIFSFPFVVLPMI
jgi:hypothetical protein